MESKLALQKKSWAARTAGSLFALLLVCVIVLSLSACEGDKATTTGNTEKEVMYELRNVSGAPMVLDSGLDAGYWDNLDGLWAEDFTKETGSLGIAHFDAEEGVKNGWIVETSPTTYEMTKYYAAGSVPEEEEYLYLDLVWEEFYPEAMGKVYTVTVSGTYNKLAVVEWDGSSFTQVE